MITIALVENIENGKMDLIPLDSNVQATCDALSKIDIKPTLDESIIIKNINYSDYFGETLEEKRVNPMELSLMYRMLDGLTGNEYDTLIAVAKEQKLTELKDMINLVSNVNSHIIITSQDTTIDIGEKVIFAKESCIVESQYKNSDFETIGHKFISENKGIEIPDGKLFLDVGESLEFYDGKILPSYLDSGKQNDFFVGIFENQNNARLYDAVLPLPKYQIDDILLRLDKEPNDIYIKIAFPESFSTLENVDIYAGNEFAKLCENMNQTDFSELQKAINQLAITDVNELIDVAISYQAQTENQTTMAGDIKKENTNKPKAEIIGADGNIFNIMSIASKSLKKAGFDDLSTEMIEKVRASESYEQALSVITDYIDPVEVGYSESEENIDWDTGISLDF